MSIPDPGDTTDSKSVYDRAVASDRHAGEGEQHTDAQQEQHRSLSERRPGTTGTGHDFKHANEGFKSITMAAPFTSIRHPLAVDLGRGRLAEEENYAEHVEQMMFQVLFTAPGERVNRPDFGCGIRRLVFAPNSEVSAALAQVTIFQALNKWLGSAIDVNDVKAQAIEERLEISITYTLKARGERRYLNLEVTR